MRFLFRSFGLLTLLCLPHMASGGFLPRSLTSLVRAAQGIFHPAGGSGRARAAVLPLVKSTTTTTASTPAVVQQAPQDANVPAAAPSIDMAALMAQMSSQFEPRKASSPSQQSFNPADLLGQLAISFDQKGKKSLQTQAGSSSGDIVAQISGMLPMILSVARPVMGNYKGTDGYDDFMVREWDDICGRVK